MTLRELFIQWLTASRFIQSLDARHHEQRQDYEIRLAEKNAQILQLRTELAGVKLECDRMRSVLMPLSTPSGAQYSQRYDNPTKPPVVPAFSGPDDWAAELNRMYQQEEANGIQEQRREIVHEPTPDDGTQ